MLSPEFFSLFLSHYGCFYKTLFIRILHQHIFLNMNSLEIEILEN
jgi:hypothetical protein